MRSERIKEALAAVRNPPPEYYAEVLAEAHEEVACANRRAERAEADNAALLAELERLRAVAEAALRLRDLYPRAGILQYLPDEDREAFETYDAALAAWEVAR